jgi:hypothetical protein
MKKSTEGNMMAAPIRKTKFVPEWINMRPRIPVPRVDWIERKQLDLPYGENSFAGTCDE